MDRSAKLALLALPPAIRCRVCGCVTVDGHYVASWDALNNRLEVNIRTCYDCMSTESAINRVVGLDILASFNQAMYDQMQSQLCR